MNKGKEVNMASAVSNIAPCPNCGTTPNVKRGIDKWTIECPKCGKKITSEDIFFAVELWQEQSK